MTRSLRLTLQLANGPLIAGRTAFSDPPPPASTLRRRAARLAYEGQLALRYEPRQAEILLRRSVEDMVDAFLLDRRGNADLFQRAHAFGALIERRFGCRWKVTEDGTSLENSCGVLALHARLGLSPGGRTWGKCSICDADDFQCDHVPGEAYEGKLCFRTIVRWDAEEVSLTPRPRDPRCFRVWVLTPVRGASSKPPRCRHCARCAGRAGPTADDLDPLNWPNDPERLIADTVDVFHAASASPGV